MNFPFEAYYTGLTNTQQLDLTTHGLPFFQLGKLPLAIPSYLPASSRLGHFAEELFFKGISIDTRITMIRNVQVIDDKTTLGELDGVLMLGDSACHVEFCYKIYLLDTDETNEYTAWIGPNRRDALHQKVEKLKTKQLPLFNHPITQNLLSHRIVNFSELPREQQVCFMAQLYVHLKQFEAKTTVNYGTPKGFYIHYDELSQFEEAQWHIPSSKTDWMVDPMDNVKWLTTAALRTHLQKHYDRDSNPLCWIKAADGKLNKCFVVNWRL
jgi:hypothetical protein